jgi:hypothetical protein
LSSVDSQTFTQVGRRRSPRFFLQAFQVSGQLDVINANFACRGEFDGAGTSVSKSVGGRRIKQRRRAK